MTSNRGSALVPVSSKVEDSWFRSGWNTALGAPLQIGLDLSNRDGRDPVGVHCGRHPGSIGFLRNPWTSMHFDESALVTPVSQKTKFVLKLKGQTNCRQIGCNNGGVPISLLS